MPPAAGVLLDTLEQTARAQTGARPATRRSRPASPSTKWPSACRSSIPEVTDISQGAEARPRMPTARMRRTPGTFAANCLLARRLAERGVRFIQLYHHGWDQHGESARRHPRPVPGHRSAGGRAGHRSEAARPAGRHAGRSGAANSAARTTARAKLSRRLRPRPSPALLHRLAGRRRHQAGHSVYGETDDFGYNIAKNPVHVHDLHATMLHCWASTTSG